MKSTSDWTVCISLVFGLIEQSVGRYFLRCGELKSLPWSCSSAVQKKSTPVNYVSVRGQNGTVKMTVIWI